MSERCSRQLFRGSWSHPSHCRQPARVQRDGQWYCTQHDPERVAARQAKRDAARERESKMRLLKGEIDNAIRNLGELFCIHPPEVCGQDERYLIGRVVTLRERLAKLEGETECKAN